MPSVTESGALQQQVRAIALAAGDMRTVFGYQAFDFVNREYFGGELRDPFILWTITNWSGCLGLCQPRAVQVIKMHPTLLGCSSGRAWGLPLRDLGPAFAFDVLLHECIHLAIAQRHGGWGGQGESSHNNDLWVAEVNRIAPLLDLPIRAGRSKVQRQPVEGPLTVRGKQPTVPMRVNEGDVPFSAVSRFPYGVRYHLADPVWWAQKGAAPRSPSGDQRRDAPSEPRTSPPFYRCDLPFPHALQCVTPGEA